MGTNLSLSLSLSLSHCLQIVKITTFFISYFFLFNSFVHGRLPYNLLKPDPVLRGLLLSLPIRKVVSFFLPIYTFKVLLRVGVLGLGILGSSLPCSFLLMLMYRLLVQVFTNSDKAHTARVLSRLGLEDCFERIICFETLNPTNKENVPVEEDDTELGVPRSSIISGTNEYMSEPNDSSVLPRTPVICKPFEESFEEVFKIANINPQRTVRILIHFPGKFLALRCEQVESSLWDLLLFCIFLPCKASLILIVRAIYFLTILY